MRKSGFAGELCTFIAHKQIKNGEIVGVTKNLRATPVRWCQKCKKPSTTPIGISLYDVHGDEKVLVLLIADFVGGG